MVKCPNCKSNDVCWKSPDQVGKASCRKTTGKRYVRKWDNYKCNKCDREFVKGK